MSENPFASFAFGGSKTAIAAPAPITRPSAGNKRKNHTVGAAASAGATRPPAGDNPKKQKAKGCKTERVDYGELSTEELREFRARWRGMADRDAAVEDQRFQVLVGAVLSSRAQATVVDEGLSRLRAREGGLTAATMSNVEQDELADVLRHVHWNKAKAKHIRESASAIVRRHRGVVPRRKGDLLALPGVGPALVEILLNVFDYWEADDAALLDKCGTGGASSSGEAGRKYTRSTVDGGSGGAGVGGDVDGARGCCADAEGKRNINGTNSEDWPVDVTSSAMV
eukprot:g13908.t1